MAQQSTSYVTVSKRAPLTEIQAVPDKHDGASIWVRFDLQFSVALCVEDAEKLLAQLPAVIKEAKILAGHKAEGQP